MAFIMYTLFILFFFKWVVFDPMVEKPRVISSNGSASDPASNENVAVDGGSSNENVAINGRSSNENMASVSLTTNRNDLSNIVATNENTPTELVASNENAQTESNRNPPKDENLYNKYYDQQLNQWVRKDEIEMAMFEEATGPEGELIFK